MSFTNLKSKYPESLYKAEDSSNVGKSWNIWARQLDEIKTVIDDLYQILNVDEQSGVVLDLIGKILRTTRNGNTDDVYKIYLYVAIRKAISSGSIEDINNTMLSLLGEDFLSARSLHTGQKSASWASGPLYRFFLDGSKYLDGTYYLSGKVFQAAFFEIIVKSTSSPVILQSLPTIIDAVKAAGVNYRIVKE